MHGWEIGSGSRKRIRHMRPVSTSTGGVAAAVDDTGLVVADSSSPRSFFKDVRKISIGDCALFKPQQDSPPFIGIIRSLGSDKEKNLQLGVNWLYRPTDVKLLKGISPEAAPNEVFYSFHRDETPAASLLHPCKVAFLPRGVELPSGISSFVCRRVYDTANKRLWWLTDQDYIDDRQEEVDKLLRKTQTEMHATVQQQQGGRSPKPVNSPMSSSQLKQSPDSVQNSTTVFPSQTKGKKRERNDQATEPVKRERSSKADDGDSGLPRSEVMLKSEIAKITEKGGLVDSQGVERLVHLMQPDKTERKDLACRSLLAGVLAATDKLDCLNQFVHLRGLRILDEWLQEAHKGKIGDSSSPRDQDRSVEDFLLVLLRALDRLPVNLNALQMCNIGKSVNHLRSHRNSEIQKKARSLVDTWKKRVEAEMNINDTKSGTSQAVSWPARTRNEVSQVTNRQPSGSDSAMKNSVSQLSSSKSAPVKLVQGEAVAKSPSASASSGNVKLSSSPASTSASLRDGHVRTSVISGSSELPQSAARDEKSSGSSHSHTNSQCSSDHAKIVGPSVKEDARSSNSGSTSLNKSSGTGSRNKKTANGLQAPAVSAHPKEDGSSRNSTLSRISISEKLSQLPVKCEKNIDAPVSDSNNHKLIVKISNRGRSPAQSVNGGSVEDPSLTNSRASSPVNPDKLGQLDHNPKEKCDGFRNSTPSDVNTESWQSNDLKDGVTGCDEGDGSPATADFGRYTTGDDAGKSTSAMQNVPSTKNEIKSRKSLDSCSINVLIESCVKYSEADVPISAGDDVGMNLLASVAAGEISKSGAASPAHSPQRSTSVADESCRDNSGKTKPDVDASIGDQNRINTSVDTEIQKQNVTSSASPACNEDQGDKCRIPDKDSLHNMESCTKSEIKIDESGAAASLKHNSVAVALQSDPMQKDEKLAIASCGTGEHFAAANSNDVKPEKIDGADVSDLAGLAGNGTIDKESGSSFVPGKHGEFRVCHVEVCQDRGCNNQNAENKEAPAQLSSSSASATQLSCSAALPENQLVSTVKMTKSAAVDEKKIVVSASVMENVSSSPALGAPGADAKLGFDLNKGCVDEGKNVESVVQAACPDTVCSVTPMQISGSSSSCSLAASVTVAAAAKGPFVAPDDLLWNKRELGWKGSAATSAFRPAEPRKVMEMPPGPNKPLLPEAPALRPTRFPLDIDLNVADESSGQESNIRNDPVCEVMTPSLRNSGGFDLDLNKFDEAPDMNYMGQQMASDIQRVEVSAQNTNPSVLNVFCNGAASCKRDFDLNDGPATEESPVEQLPSSQYNRGNIALHSSSGLRANSSDTRNSFSWYAPGTSYSVSVTPSALPDREAFPFVGRGGGPQRVMGGPNSTLSFSPDSYRGSVLSSSPALPFHPPQFQYPVLQFGTSFPLSTPPMAVGSSGYTDLAASGRVPAIPSQLVGNAAAVPFQYPHAYVVSHSIPDVCNNSVIESNHKWGKQGLDLNSGPGVSDVEGREESLQTRQVSAISSQSLAEDQARMYCMGGGHQKRKEPDGGWNMENLNFKQSSWR